MNLQKPTTFKPPVQDEGLVACEQRLQSRALLDHLIREMRCHLPFSNMPQEDLLSLAQSAVERYAAPESVIWEPDSGVPEHLFWLRQGRVSAQPQVQGGNVGELDVGDFWPVGALLARRRVTTRYTALEDCFYVCWPLSVVQAMLQKNLVWADFLNQRLRQQLVQSVRNLQKSIEMNAQQQILMEAPLSDLPTKELVSLQEDVSLRDGLACMHQKKTGSVLLLNASGNLQGILTRWDVLDRVALANHPLDRPIREVMTSPVLTIDAHSTGLDAALMMSRHALRHLPVISKGQVVNVVSERDLFSMQNHTISRTTEVIAQARNLAELENAARNIRALAAQWMQQGMRVLNLTALISQLNDRLTRQLIELVLKKQNLCRDDMCWIALGSEGRSEQTIATDQDNALLFSSQQPAQDRVRWLSFANEVNQGLAICGFPLCKGGVMASNPECCLTLTEWEGRFAHWIDRGSPKDLLKASIFFDLRGLAGYLPWVETLRQEILQRIRRTPRFLHQLVENNQSMSNPLNWHGGLLVTTQGGQRVVNLKLSGTALVVDAVRTMALARGISATNTVERLREVARLSHLSETEVNAWMTAFEYLQTHRLRRQIQVGVDAINPNSVPLDELNLVDQRMLKVAFSAVRNLQQRLSLEDWR